MANDSKRNETNNELLYLLKKNVIEQVNEKASFDLKKSKQLSARETHEHMSEKNDRWKYLMEENQQLIEEQQKRQTGSKETVLKVKLDDPEFVIMQVLKKIFQELYDDLNELGLSEDEQRQIFKEYALKVEESKEYLKEGTLGKVVNNHLPKKVAEQNSQEPVSNTKTRDANRNINSFEKRVYEVVDKVKGQVSSEAVVQAWRKFCFLSLRCQPGFNNSNSNRESEETSYEQYFMKTFQNTSSF